MIRLFNKFRSEFFVVLLANLFSYLVTFSGSIIYVRLLGKYNFGIYTFSFNIISIFLLVNGFGAASGVLQYVSKSKNEAEKLNYLAFAFRSALLFNLIISILIIVYALYFNLPIPNAKKALLAMALFPIGRLYIDLFQAYLRASGKNKLQAKFLVVNNFILLASSIIGILVFKLYGLIYFTYLGYIIMLIFSFWYFKLPNIFSKISFELIKIKEFIYYSFFTTLSNAFSGLLFVLDILIISYIIHDVKLIAIYRVATIIPFAINFIPNMVINYYYPEFAKNSDNPGKIYEIAKMVRIRLFIFSSLTSLFLIVSAKYIILNIFGNNYQMSILPFQILSFGYWIIATFRTVNGNIIAALGRAKLSLYLTFVILILNVIITYYMVTNYSIVGASIAVVIIYSISSLMGYISLKFILAKSIDL